MSDKPRFFIAWRHNGENCWEAVSENKVEGLLKKLLESGVNPASVFSTTLPMAHWLFPSHHKGCSQVWIRDLYDEIGGTGNPSDCSGPDVPVKEKEPEMLFGFVSPDGRHFKCDFGGHSTLAKEIVGKLYDVKDAQKYLEEQGWLVIYRDFSYTGTYAVHMGKGKKNNRRTGKNT